MQRDWRWDEMLIAGMGLVVERKRILTNRCGTKPTVADLFLAATWGKEPGILQKYS